MREIVFVGDSLKRLREFSDLAKRKAGHELDALQQGLQPTDFKPMPSIGAGVEEIRVWDGSGTYRVIYTARRAEKIYVLHAFQKKTQATAQEDIELAKQRLKLI